MSRRHFGAALAIVALAAPHSQRHVGWVTDLASHGGELWSCSQAGVFVGTGELARVVEAPFRPFAVAAFGDRRLVVAGGRPAKSGELAVIEAGRIVARRRLAEDLIYDVAVPKAGARAIVAVADGRILAVDLPRLSRVVELARHTAAACAVALSPDGELLASAGLDRLVQLRTLAEKAKPKILEEHTGAVECIAFSPDGRLLASGARDGKVRLHGRDGTYKRTWKDLGGKVRAVRWHGRHVLALLRGGEVHSFDSKSGEHVRIRDTGGGPFFSLAVVGRTAYLGGRRIVTLPLP